MADTVNNVWSSLGKSAGNLLMAGASAYDVIATAKAKLNQSRAAPAGTPTDTRSMNNQVPGNFSSKPQNDEKPRPGAVDIISQNQKGLLWGFGLLLAGLLLFKFARG